jgi:hypothetical protein
VVSITSDGSTVSVGATVVGAEVVGAEVDGSGVVGSEGQGKHSRHPVLPLRLLAILVP